MDAMSSLISRTVSATERVEELSCRVGSVFEEECMETDGDVRGQKYLCLFLWILVSSGIASQCRWGRRSARSQFASSPVQLLARQD